ncbi:TonB-dependent siderophore receptor [Roseivirga sp. E12]|uniref:TonB-dependent receptor plug domain-containing protein n=1 Tax=Roseivirga sp. E12 TaxID=2819237 RepID=UPI001ABC6E5B|nr:TonB-dependent receptor [Roseivirga sp. E12]MBO3696976.1 TonB-dependent receptor [Roseivirga sp. E12]
MLKSLRSTCFLWTCCLLLGIGQWSLAQSNQSIIEVFKSLEQKHNVVFSYNPKLIGLLRLSVNSSSQSLDASLETISDRLPLKFERAGANGILVIPVRSSLEFKAIDADDQRPIDLIYVAVNNQQPNYLLPKNGLYRMEDVFITDSLAINTSFYHQVSTTVMALQAGGNTVSMKAETTDLGDVTILSYITTGVNSVLGDHRIEVDMSDLGLIAGETDGDVFQVLQAVPGIRSPNGKPGSLNLRGGPFDQNLMLFDNIPIYHTGHFFGTFSPYNPGIVDKISVYRGGLPASWGGRVGGVVDIKTQQHVPDSLSIGLMTNTVTSGLELRVPVVKDKLGFVFSARAKIFGDMPPKLEAYYDLNFQGSRISDIALNGPIELRNLNIGFSDMNGKLIYKPSSKHHLSLSFLTIGNDFSYELFSRNQNRIETEVSELDNWGMTLEWQAQLTEAINLRTRYTSSQFRLEEQRTEPRNNGNGVNREFVENGIDDQRIDLALKVKLDEKTDLNAGYEFSNHDITFDDTVDGDNPQVVDRRSGNGDINSLYLSLKHQFSDKLIVDAGLRSNHFSVGDQSFLAPKLFVSYLVSNSFFLKGSATGAYQYVRQNFANDFDDFRIENQFWTLVDDNIPVLRGKQYMFGGLVDRGSWLFDVEFYQKDVSNVIRPGGNQTPNLTGDLNIKGIDFLAKKRWDGFESWISYSLSKAEESFRVQQQQGPPRVVTREAFYDQRHVLNLKFIVPMNRWSLAASWSLMSGVPVYEADRDEILDNNGNQYDIEYTGNFPAQHQLDLSASYVFSKPTAGWRGVLGFSILNVYDRRNIINAFQQNVNINNTIRYGLGFSPNIQLKVTF